MKGSVARLCYNGKETDRVLKDYMERSMNHKNDWDHNFQENTVEGPVDCACKGGIGVEINEDWNSPWTFSCIIGVDCCYQGSRHSSDD